MNPQFTGPKIDECPAGWDWGIDKIGMKQIREGYKAFLARNGAIEDKFRMRPGQFANRKPGQRIRRVERKLSDAPGLSVEQVSQKVGIAPQTVSKHIRKGWLKVTRHGHRTVRIDPADFHKYRERIGK